MSQKCSRCGRDSDARPRMQYWAAEDGEVVCNTCFGILTANVRREEAVRGESGMFTTSKPKREVVSREAPYAGKKLEYRISRFSPKDLNNGTLEVSLETLGKSGWELVGCTSMGGLVSGSGLMCIFMREHR